MVLQIASLNLTGATVGQTGSVSWARTNRPATLTQVQRGQHPWLELVNMSACFLAVVVGVGSDSVPLPPGSWHIYPLSQDDTSYSFTVLTNNQNASNNTVFGWYYSADEPSPTSGQIVNQSQALAAPAQLLTATQNISGGGGSVTTTLGPSTTAATFSLYAVTLSFFTLNAASAGGIGRGVFLIIKSHTPNATIWQANVQEAALAYHFILNLSILNATPGTTTITIEADPISFSNPVFTYAGSLSVIATTN